MTGQYMFHCAGKVLSQRNTYYFRQQLTQKDFSWYKNIHNFPTTAKNSSKEPKAGVSVARAVQCVVFPTLGNQARFQINNLF
jgi:hypothetical protein